MYVDYTADVTVVMAARSGDQRALDELIRGCLPLVYNIAGRALDGHDDVDDVVQETMLQVVDGLGNLRSPESFRSWMVAITLQKVRERWRNQQTRAVVGELDEAYGTADPGADFVDLTVLRLGLSGQRREVAEATRWLEPEERELLSLWWLEAAGELTREELAAALDLPPAHAAVRVQRMKARLDTARSLVRALRASPPCADLVLLTVAWDGLPAALWRKRLGRHTRECPTCAQRVLDLVPTEGLLLGMALVQLPAGFAVNPLLHTSALSATHAAGWLSRLGRWLAAKPVAAVAAGTAVLGGGAATGYLLEHRAALPPVTRPAASPAVTAPPTVPAPAPAPAPASPSASPTAPGALYGRTIDQVDTPPAAGARPAALPVRPEDGPVAVSGAYAKRQGRNAYLLAHRGEYLTVSGRGYFVLDWQVGYLTRGPGQLQMPTWTGLEGRIFHAASGGGHRMDDPKPGSAAGWTWMGEPGKGWSTVPPGTQQMWQHEYYYLDGTVTLHLNERGTDYNLVVAPATRSSIVGDLTQPPSPDPAEGRVRYGLVRDTGTDDAPVPQYLTRADPADPMSVDRRSQVGAERR